MPPIPNLKETLVGLISANTRGVADWWSWFLGSQWPSGLKPALGLRRQGSAKLSIGRHPFLPSHPQAREQEDNRLLLLAGFFQTLLPATRFVYMGSFSPSKSLGTTTGCDRSDVFRFCLSPGQEWGSPGRHPRAPRPPPQAGPGVARGCAGGHSAVQWNPVVELEIVD